MTESSDRRKKLIHYFFIVAIAVFIFLLNSGHLTQQSTFDNIFIKLAENIISGKGYVLEQYGNQEMLYPLWGYVVLLMPGVAIGIPEMWISALQFVLSIAGINYFYKAFDLSKRYWHLPLFLPYFAVMSVKWPDAIVAFLIIALIYYLKKATNSQSKVLFMVSGFLLGMIGNLRSEYVLILVALSIVFIVRSRKDSFGIIQIGVLILPYILLMMPWAIRAKSISDEFRISATNGGFVSYISLGQLSDNPWGIRSHDTTAINLAEEEGFDNPFSAKADSMFRSKFTENIMEQPGAYAERSLKNLIRSISGGVYTGEYANFLIGKQNRQTIDNEIGKSQGMLDQIGYIFDLDVNRSIPMIFEKGVQLSFRFVFLLLIFSSLYLLIRNWQMIDIFSIILLIIILHKFIIVTFVQYEYRHMNAIYLPLFGLFLMYLNSKKDK